MSPPADTPRCLNDICETLRAEADEASGSKVSLQTILDAFQGRAFGPLLVVPGLVIVIPTFGAIPSVPTIMGVFVILLAGQKLCGRNHPWVPKFVASREISKKRFHQGLKLFQPWARRVDFLIRPRWRFLVTGKMKLVIALLCILLACSIPPLELLPWAAAVPGAGIFFLGLAITAEDGFLGLLGMLATGGVIGIFVWWFWFSG